MRSSLGVLASYLALTLSVAGCDSGSPLAPTEPSVSPAASSGGSGGSGESGGSVSMNASKWEFTFSPGMPSRPTDVNNGWQFVFPTRDGVHYLTTKHGPKSASRSITASIAVETTGNPYFEYRTNPDNTCVTPSTVRLYLQRKGDNMSGEGKFEFYRWWSINAAYVLGPGQVVLAGDLTDPSRWLSVLGQHGDANEPMFRAALADLGAVGFTFGGGCFYGHGVYVTPDSGRAVFKATDYAVR